VNASPLAADLVERIEFDLALSCTLGQTQLKTRDRQIVELRAFYDMLSSRLSSTSFTFTSELAQSLERLAQMQPRALKELSHELSHAMRKHSAQSSHAQFFEQLLHQVISAHLGQRQFRLAVDYLQFIDSCILPDVFARLVNSLAQLVRAEEDPANAQSDLVPLRSFIVQGLLCSPFASASLEKVLNAFDATHVAPEITNHLYFPFSILRASLQHGSPQLYMNAEVRRSLQRAFTFTHAGSTRVLVPLRFVLPCEQKESTRTDSSLCACSPSSIEP
jgi:hypothetical protein